MRFSCQQETRNGKLVWVAYDGETEIASHRDWVKLGRIVAEMTGQQLRN